MNKGDVVGFLAVGQFVLVMLLVWFTDLVPDSALGGVLFSVPFILVPVCAQILFPKDFQIGKKK